MPALMEIRLEREKVTDWDTHPFSVPAIQTLNQVDFSSQVCFLVGENGSGKSTLLEAIAVHTGFGKEGGSRNIAFNTTEESAAEQLASALRLSWRKKLLKGYFLRAESFFNVATYLDDNVPSALAGYGGKSLHKQSHGESFLALLKNRFSQGGFYLLDEPEAALSPQRQLSFLVILNDLVQRNAETQFIVITHSPIIMAYPDAQIFSFDNGRVSEIEYVDTEAYRITKGFLDNPNRFIRHLFE
jgi:predicted ATPase